MTDDLVKRLRERPNRRGNESNDEANERRQKERDEAADCIEAQDKRNKELEAALQFYRDGFRYHVKRTSMGINLSEWKPTEELLNDCGETARSVLAGEKKND